MPLTSDPCAIDLTATPGELPGRTWISRGAKARTKLLRPVKSCFGHPAVERPGIGEVLLELRREDALVEIGDGVLADRFEHAARQDVRRGHAVEAFLHVLVVGRHQPLAGLDQEVDDLRQRAR